MGKVVNFDFSSERIKKLIEDTKKKVYQICEECGHRFTKDTAKFKNGKMEMVCPNCNSKRIKVELKK